MTQVLKPPAGRQGPSPCWPWRKPPSRARQFWAKHWPDFAYGAYCGLAVALTAYLAYRALR
jgi:hypothetical protein